MQTSTVISNREDTIDSRDIRPRIKALEDELYAEYDAEFEDLAGMDTVDSHMYRSAICFNGNCWYS